MNFRHPWFPLVIALEQRFGGLAIPGLIRFLSIFQLLVVILERVQPGYMQYLTFNWAKILNFEVWRLFGFMFISSPGPSPSIFWAVIVMFIMWFISDVLEQAWGSYKVSLYVFSTIFLQMVTLIAMSTVLRVPHEAVEFYSEICGRFLYASAFMATAAHVPDYEFRLFFLIPVKLKWLSVIVFASTLLVSMSLPFGMILFCSSLLPFFIVFLPGFIFGMRHRQKAAERKRKFQAEQMPDGDVFHRCAKCGITDVKDPEMDFRVTEDDEEYCVNCLEERAKTGE